MVFQPNPSATTVCRICLGGLVVHVVDYDHGYRTKPHSHDASFINLLLRGLYSGRLGAHDRSARPGQILLYGHGDEHNGHWTGASRIVHLEIDGVTRRDEATTLRPIVGEHTHRAVRVLGALSEGCLRGSPRAELEQLAETALAIVSRRPDRSRPGWLDRAEELLRDSLTETPNLAQIAEELGVHPGHLSREFHRWIGCTPIDYQHRLRTQRAATRLTRERTSLALLAVQLGFADQSHFGRVFRRHIGVSPGEYRRLAGGVTGTR